MLASIFLGLLELVAVAGTHSGCDRDENVMLQVPQMAEISYASALMPDSGEHVETLTQAGSPSQSKIPGLIHAASYTSLYMLGCAFMVFSLWSLTCCFLVQRCHSPWKLRAYIVKEKVDEDYIVKEKVDESKEAGDRCTSTDKADGANLPPPSCKAQGIPPYIQAALDDARCAQPQEGSLKTVDEVVPGPNVMTVEATRMPPGIGMCCCSSGLAKLMKPPPRDFPRKDSLEESFALLSNQDSMFPPLKDAPLPNSLVPFTVPDPPQKCVSNGHPNFTGTWKCVSVEGELDELLVDYGLGYLIRKAAKAYGYGAGHVRRICDHKGNRISYHEMGIQGFDNTVAFDVPCTDVHIDQHLQTTQWDEVQSHVLIVEATDLQKATPSTWSTSWHYLVDENTLHIKTRSRADHVGLWVYEREA